MSKKIHKPIEPGTVVLTYNKWTNYSDQAIANFFRRASLEDIQSLKECDIIWIYRDPLHPNGKVYGFEKSKFIRRIGQKVYFEGGSTTLHEVIFIVNDEEGLSKLVADNPKSTDIIGDQGRMVSQLLCPN